MKLFSIFALTAAFAVTLSAADISQAIDVKRWVISECTAKTEGNTLVVNMPIDSKTGQYQKYLIGWPRIYLYKMQGMEKDWSKAKAVSFDLKLEFTGKTEKFPITFHVFTKTPGAKKDVSVAATIPALKNNTLNKVVMPLDKVKDSAFIFGFGFSISESRYKHGENLKFTVSNFKLINK
jgi:hypothetical protein